MHTLAGTSKPYVTMTVPSSVIKPKDNVNKEVILLNLKELILKFMHEKSMGDINFIIQLQILPGVKDCSKQN